MLQAVFTDHGQEVEQHEVQSTPHSHSQGIRFLHHTPLNHRLFTNECYVVLNTAGSSKKTISYIL